MDPDLRPLVSGILGEGFARRVRVVSACAQYDIAGRRPATHAVALTGELAYIFAMHVPVALYPQLALLCWNRADDAVLEGAEAFAVYERNWRFIDPAALEAGERDLIDALKDKYGNGVILTS